MYIWRISNIRFSAFDRRWLLPLFASMNMIRSIVLLLGIVCSAFAEQPVVAASSKHPQRIVAKVQHSGKPGTLLTEAQLRSNAKKIKKSANSLMGVKAADLMPTWSTTNPQVKGKTTVEEGELNLKYQAHVDHKSAKDDHKTQAHTPNK
jgi:hypothetical protein